MSKTKDFWYAITFRNGFISYMIGEYKQEVIKKFCKDRAEDWDSLQSRGYQCLPVVIGVVEAA